MSKPLLVFLLFAIIVFGAVGQGSIWYANGASLCQVQITEIDHPATVQANQLLMISTHLMVTCSPVNQNVVARVDVVSNETRETITSNSTGIGVIQVNTPSHIKIVNVTVANTVRAPSEGVNWRLEVHAWVFTGPNLAANVTQIIQIPVVNPQVTPTTATELMQNSTTTSSTSANLGVGGTLGLVIAVALAISLVILIRRRKQKPVTGKHVAIPKSNN